MTFQRSYLKFHSLFDGKYIVFNIKVFYQLMHKRIALKGVLIFTLKQLQHVPVLSPSSGSALYELAKVTVDKTVN